MSVYADAVPTAEFVTGLGGRPKCWVECARPHVLVSVYADAYIVSGLMFLMC